MLLVFPLNLYYSYDEEPINHLSLLHIIHEDVTFAAAAAKPLQSCPTLLPHRQQPTRHRGPWDSCCFQILFMSMMQKHFNLKV